MADDESDLLVTISGPALSLLLFENARCQDQIGFLLGEIQMFVTKKVTDSDRAVENIKTHINIKSIIAHPMGCEPFFNTPGQLDEARLIEFLQEDLHKVVGWYHYRYNHKIELNSLRDRTLHTGLSKFFSNINNLQKQENYLFFLMATTENETRATHKFKHLLYRREGKVFKPVSFRINNLGADASRPDGSDYKPIPIHTSYQHDSFDEVYRPFRSDLQKLSGLESVQLIERSAEAYLAELVLEVNESDKIVTELSEQLYEMKHNYYRKQFEKEKLRLQMQMCSMEVDVQPVIPSLLFPSSITKSEARSSMSPSITKSEPRSPMSPSFTKSEPRSPMSPSITRSEARSPDSPLMFDPPKMSPSSSNIKMAVKKPLRQESSEERTRDPTSSEREKIQRYNIRKSPQTTGDWKTVCQRRSEYLQASNNSTSSFNDKGRVRKSLDYDAKNS